MVAAIDLESFGERGPDCLSTVLQQVIVHPRVLWGDGEGEFGSFSTTQRFQNSTRVRIIKEWPPVVLEGRSVKFLCADNHSGVAIFPFI